MGHSLKISLIFFISTLFIANINSQIFAFNYDLPKEDRSPLFGISLSKKISNSKIMDVNRYYDFGFNVNILKYKFSHKFLLGADSFIDIHVIDRFGYEKLGLRLTATLTFPKNFQLSFSPGYVLNSSNRNSTPTTRVLSKRGTSNEIVILYDKRIGISTRIDVSKTETSDYELDLGMGIKYQGEKTVLLGGVLGLLTSVLFNQSIRSN